MTSAATDRTLGLTVPVRPTYYKVVVLTVYGEYIAGPLQSQIVRLRTANQPRRRHQDVMRPQGCGHRPR